MTAFLDLNKNTGFLDLSKAAPSLTKLRGALNWDMHPIHGKDLNNGFDLDIFIFGLNAQKKIQFPQDVCFFNNKTICASAIQMSEDNRTGLDSAPGQDDEFFTADLSKIPADKASFDVFVFIHDATNRRQNFGMMANARFELRNEADGSLIQGYNISQFTTGSALHIGTVERKGDTWNFNPVGEAAEADPNQVAQAYL